MRRSLIHRLEKLEARFFPERRPPLQVLMISMRPGETQDQAAERHLAENPELVIGPASHILTVFLEEDPIDAKA